MIFLKLGGSLITDKSSVETARPEVIERIATEIADYLDEKRDIQLLIGHGSGSFGHEAAARHGTHQGARSAQDWRGFAEVWAAAQRLNRLVVDSLRGHGLPALTFSPSASATTAGGRLESLAVEPVRRALANGLLPIVHGDVAFDRQRGAAIVSTEEVFLFLAQALSPDRILLAGAEPGVAADYPGREEILPEISTSDWEDLSLFGSEATDVTGGMAAKVRHALELAERMPVPEIRIFSGRDGGAIYRCLQGEGIGTRIRGPD